MIWNWWYKKEKPLPSMIGMGGGATGMVNTGASGPGEIQATGGTKTSPFPGGDGKTYVCHYWSAPPSGATYPAPTTGFQVTAASTNPDLSNSLHYLVVGSGGGGAQGGGGGAGGVRTNIPTTWTNLPSPRIGSAWNATVAEWEIEIGTGGSGNKSNGTSGGNSSISSIITAYGGGYGGTGPGGAGGSGGGAGPGGTAGSASPGPGGNPGQDGCGPSICNGGGGGALGAGGEGERRGGNGVQVIISGPPSGPNPIGVVSQYAGSTDDPTSFNWGGGGGGAGREAPKPAPKCSGGRGGGGQGGTDAVGGDGVNGCGGGGGGGSSGPPSNQYGGAGGTGIVAIRYEVAP